MLARFDQDGLRFLLSERLKSVPEPNVPVNIGEWGPLIYAFLDGNQRGGFEFVRDLLQVFNERCLNYQYFTYETIYFEGWEYAQQPELATVTDTLATSIFPGNLGM